MTAASASLFLRLGISLLVVLILRAAMHILLIRKGRHQWNLTAVFLASLLLNIFFLLSPLLVPGFNFALKPVNLLVAPIVVIAGSFLLFTSLLILERLGEKQTAIKKKYEIQDEIVKYTAYPPVLYAAFANSVLLKPISEEIFFRNVLFMAIKTTYDPWAALIAIVVLQNIFKSPTELHFSASLRALFLTVIFLASENILLCIFISVLTSYLRTSYFIKRFVKALPKR